MIKRVSQSPLHERNQAIIADDRAGMLQYKIAEKYGISRARVAQFIAQERFWETRQMDWRKIFAEATNFDDLPIELIPTTVRAYHGLLHAGAKTVGEALQLDDMELIAIPNFGRKSLKDLKLAIEELRQEFANRGQQ